MRIHDPNLNSAAAAQTGGAHEVHGTGRANARSVGSAAGGDRVELSDTLGALSRALAAHESGRAARVEELAARYSRGEYRADSAATSRAMLADALSAG